MLTCDFSLSPSLSFSIKNVLYYVICFFLVNVHYIWNVDAIVSLQC